MQRSRQKLEPISKNSELRRRREKNKRSTSITSKSPSCSAVCKALKLEVSALASPQLMVLVQRPMAIALLTSRQRLQADRHIWRVVQLALWAVQHPISKAVLWSMSPSARSRLKRKNCVDMTESWRNLGKWCKMNADFSRPLDNSITKSWRPRLSLRFFWNRPLIR